jgi:hypothetical protein
MLNHGGTRGCSWFRRLTSALFLRYWSRFARVIRRVLVIDRGYRAAAADFVIARRGGRVFGAVPFWERSSRLTLVAGRAFRCTGTLPFSLRRRSNTFRMMIESPALLRSDGVRDRSYLHWGPWPAVCLLEH